VAAVDRATGEVQTLLADGGATANRTLMQLQADTSGRRVERALAQDLSALGVAHLAGRTAGVWSDGQLEGLERAREHYAPVEDPQSRERRQTGWHTAISRSRGTAAGGSRLTRSGSALASNAIAFDIE
jgi:glycerol kinase